MKKFIRKLSILLILFLLIDFTLGQIFDTLFFKVKSGTIYNSVYGIQNCNEDIIIMGASEVKHSFISKQIENETGFTCYNLGFDGHNIYYHYAVLRELINRYTPKAVAISTTVVADDETTINSLFTFRKRYPRIKETIFELSPVERIKLISNAYAYNSLAIKIIQGLILPEPPTNGYMPIFGTITDIKLDSIDLELYDSNRTLEYYDRFLKLATSSGCKVFVINTPKYIFNKSNDNRLKIEQLVSRYNVVYLNYENDTTFTNHNQIFRDKMHLNHSGAQIFTDRFVSDIKTCLTNPY